MRGCAVAAVAVCLAALAGPAAASPARSDSRSLLATYAPVLRLYAVDRWPSAVEPFLAAANLERRRGAAWQLIRRSPPAAALTHGSGDLRLDTRGCSPAVDLDTCYGRRSTPPTFYGRAWTAPEGSGSVATVLEYWFFYALDDWRNSVRKPSLWHMHEGDWEQVSVALDASGKALEVAASQHNLGVHRPWGRVSVRNGTHPVVYVALGSHANYFAAGFHGAAGVPHVIPPNISGLPLPEPDFTAAQRTVAGARIVDISSSKQPWLSFAGGWGDGSYVLIRTSKTGYAHLPVGGSPSGPAFHDVWRDPLLQFQAWPDDDGH